jgi:hypothetical protein
VVAAAAAAAPSIKLLSFISDLQKSIFIGTEPDPQGPAGSIPAISYKNNSAEKDRTVFTGDYSPSQRLRTKLDVAQQAQTASGKHSQVSVCFFCNMLFCNPFSIP